MSVERVILIVMDSVGAGETPDADRYGDQGANTLGHIAENVGGADLPNLAALGLGNILPLRGVAPAVRPRGAHGKCAELSAGKDTATGHWELAGLCIDKPFPVFSKGFPSEILAPFMRETGRGVLGNRHASGTEIIEQLGEEHVRTGDLIVYTSGDSVFQIAAHEDVVPIEELYRICKIARAILNPYNVGRVIARPFVGPRPGEYVRTYNRKDFAMPPPEPTVLDTLLAAGFPVLGVGKIPDIYCHRGIGEEIHTEGNADGMRRTREVLDRVDRGLVFVNLVDFDSLYGHRRDPAGYYRCLREFDGELGALTAAIDPGRDLVIITADHGNDPTFPGSDHTREYVPLLAFGPAAAAGVDLGTRTSFADVGATVADVFDVTAPPVGTSFLGDLTAPLLTMKNFLPLSLIRKKRDGQRLSEEELRAFIAGVSDSSIPDYQVAAMLMAIFFRGLDGGELATWADAMLRSGDIIDLGAVDRPKVDKHSTGGVGDKISLPLAAAVAACGAAVPMVSGRGLGHTGGTLDKLESIPGFRVDLPVDKFVDQVRRIGVCLIGQTDRVAPADRRLYALRDVTGTVESIPLIASSIMSKKLAEGIDALVLDCKVGDGAFMKSRAEAVQLARAIQTIGVNSGVRVTAVLTNMDAPIGRTVGNAIEVRESIEVLRGGGPPDTRELTVTLGGEMLALAGIAKDPTDGRTRVARSLDDGAALEVFRRVVEAQGGDPRVVDTPDEILPVATRRIPVPAAETGTVRAIAAQTIGLAAVLLGAGRRRVEDSVDPAAGIQIEAQLGERIERGQPIAWILASNASDADAEAARELVSGAFKFGAAMSAPHGPLVLEVLR